MRTQNLPASTRLPTSRLLSAFGIATMLAGCAVPLGPSEPTAPTAPTTPTPPAAPAAGVYQIRTPFDAAQAERMVARGSNTVTGRAFLRKRDGSVVTCAGQPVYLVPATDYARIRVKALYGSEERGAMIGASGYRFEPDPPEYGRLVRQTQCDAQGEFRVERVASGEFFVTAVVRWQEGEKREGGSLMQRVTLGGGRLTNVVLSR